jgi:hypothetical protein
MSPNTTTPHTFRSRLPWIALLGVVPLTLFVQWSDMTVGGTMAAGPFPPLAACLQWGLLLGINTLFARRTGHPFLNRSEMLIILAVWLTANMVAGRGLLHPLLASLAGPTYYARSGAVKEAVSRNLPDWLALTNRTAAGHFFEGGGAAVPWSLWLRPLGTWALFFVPFLTANVCLCSLFERVWVRHERLAFPLVMLPIEGFQWADERAEAHNFRRAVGFGLAIPLLLHGLGVANAYIPSIPCVPFFNEVSSTVTDPPWTAIRPLYVNIYPLLIGLTFLAPTDVTFSVWFFILLNKVEMVVTAAAGWNDGATGAVTSMQPYVEEQSAGAYLVLGGFLIWNARRHLLGIARAMVKDKTRHSESEEDYRTYRPLAFGFLAGVAGMLFWCNWTGLPLWFSICFFGFYLIVALVLSRLMAEGGIPWILAPVLPDKLIMSLTGSAALSPVILTRLALHVQHLRDTRQMLMPALFEAGKLRDAAAFPLRRFYGLILAGVFLALIVGVGSALPIFYQHGALALSPNSDGLMMSTSVIPTTAVGQLTSRLLTPVKPSMGAATAVVAGGAITWVLSIMRVRFLWWPLHPLGYALTGTLQLGYANKMLFSIFLGWAFKTLTLRFGGARGFRLLRGAALGLILGDLLMGGILKLLDALLGPSGYAIF